MTESGTRVADASVEVEGSALRTATRRDGSFHLSLGTGEYRLLVKRVGFVGATVVASVKAEELQRDTLFVLLAAAPTQLRSIVVSEQQESPMSTTITAETIRQAPPLVEPDVFRLLTLLPGISQPNDVLSRVHLAGGASDEHAITLDGHPLQSPFHVNSVLGAFNVAALERADVLMHHVPSMRDGHLSGEIALKTKQPAVKRSRELVVSLVSASATVTQPSIAGFDVLVSARTSYLDKILRQYVRATGSTDDILLPEFRDVLLRVDREWRQRWSGSIIGFSTRDAWIEDNPATRNSRPKWGEDLMGFKLGYRGNQWEFGARLSSNRAFAIRPGGLVTLAMADSLRRQTIQLTHQWVAGGVSAQRTTPNWQSKFGVSFTTRDHTHRWSGTDVFELFRSAVPLSIDARTRQTIAGAFSELSYVPSRRWSATGGAHVSVVNGSAYLAPRLLFSVQPAPVARIDLAFNRRFQFDAIAGEPQEGSITQPVFLLKVPRQADVVAMSADLHPAAHASGARVTANLSAYFRKYRNRTIADTSQRHALNSAQVGAAATQLHSDADELFLRAPGTTVGLTLTSEMTARNGMVLRASYTRQRARESPNNVSQPTAWDAPHQISAFTSIPIRTKLTLTATAQMHSGRAATPVKLRLLKPTGYGQFYPDLFYGDPLTARTPGYSRVDLGMRYRWRGLGADWALSLQAINVLARTNPVDYYVGQYALCARRAGACEYDGARSRSLPLLPSLGVEVRW